MIADPDHRPAGGMRGRGTVPPEWIAALRVRGSERHEGSRPAARGGRHRPRHGQPGRPAAAPRGAEAGRDPEQPQGPRLLDLARHPGPAPRPRRLLPAPLQRRARSGERGGRHPRLQGGPRQSRPGDRGAGRRGGGAGPLLSDPRLRPDLRRRDVALGPDRSRHRSVRRASSARCARSRSRAAWW